MHLPDASDTPLPGLLALHIRRGDYIHHCMHFAHWSSQYNTFNGFPDRCTPPPGGGGRGAQRWGGWWMRNLVLTPEQKYVTQAVDMPIALRAEVFIGNGFASLTSNVYVRMARGLPPETTHFR
ncbi:hypothetical protein FA95DRAFT_1572095 [Auriscalpium vulgare]|uniref:Uncharacterized protein n=1 Tax=Auriscalpium vulgare TaxID=40419 RepID=A0ACB8RW31_9AGAM|nr:hypothetical protein FA95DRAFT_1572095 [Auriscalpium vulgare]